MELLLLSNSTNYGEPYLGWCRSTIAEFLKGRSDLVFIPYAGVSISYSEYEDKVNEAMSEYGISVRSIHHYSDRKKDIQNADGILVGGGTHQV